MWKFVQGKVCTLFQCLFSLLCCVPPGNSRGGSGHEEQSGVCGQASSLRLHCQTQPQIQREGQGQGRVTVAVTVASESN